jgi:hypothetical protein
MSAVLDVPAGVKWQVRYSSTAKPLGCAGNTRRALDEAFSSFDSDFIILAEEDVVVSNAILDYFTWAAQAYEADSQVAAVCAHAHTSQAAPGLSSGVVRRSWFNPLIWGTWRDRWPFIRAAWDTLPAGAAWDSWLRGYFQEHSAQAIFPLRSLSQHIGKLSTQYGPEIAELFYKPSLSTCFDADVPAGSRQWAEVADNAGFSLLV